MYCIKIHFEGMNHNSFLAKSCGFIRVAALEISGLRPGLKRLVKKTRPDSIRADAPATGPGSEKYQRILDAAVEVIAEHGYFSSPVSAIAKRAGVADGTIYLYFKSKDDVLRTAIDSTFDKFHRQVEEEFKTLHDPRAQLEYIAQVHLESHAVNRSMAVLMQTEVRQSAEVYRGVFASSSGEVHPGGARGGAGGGSRRGSFGGMFRMVWWLTVCSGRSMSC